MSGPLTDEQIAAIAHRPIDSTPGGRWQTAIDRNDLLNEVERLKAEVKKLTDQLDDARTDAADGAETDGDHHKQWYLVGIARALGYSWPEGHIDEGIAP